MKQVSLFLSFNVEVRFLAVLSIGLIIGSRLSTHKMFSPEFPAPAKASKWIKLAASEKHQQLLRNQIWDIMKIIGVGRVS